MMKRLMALLAVLAVQSGCGRDCVGEADAYRQRKCAIKVTARKFKGNWFEIEGINVHDGKRNMYAHTGDWYKQFENQIDVGDTVMKQPNELIFSIHKKDTVLVFPFDCNGQQVE